MQKILGLPPRTSLQLAMEPRDPSPPYHRASRRIGTTAVRLVKLAFSNRMLRSVCQSDAIALKQGQPHFCRRVHTLSYFHILLFNPFMEPFGPSCIRSDRLQTELCLRCLPLVSPDRSECHNISAIPYQLLIPTMPSADPFDFTPNLKSFIQSKY